MGRRSLRVCHLAYTFYERDNRVRRYAEALANRGDHVEVISLSKPGESTRMDYGGVRVYRPQQRQVTEGAAATYLAKLLLFLARGTAVISVRHARQRYDVVHIHNVPDFLVFAAWLPKLTGARIILDIHDILPELYSDKFDAATNSWTFRSLLRVERSSARFASHVIVAGELWRDRLIRRAGLPPERCTTLLNYPDRSLFKPVCACERRQDGKFIILYPGSLNHHQGVDIAINAFAAVRHRMPNAELHIYGEGPAREQLADLIEQKKLRDCVKLSPAEPIDAIAGVIANADLGVIPKRAEGFGNEAFSTKSLEFMACGVPVVMSRTAVDSRHFDNSVVRFFESGNSADLASAFLADYEGESERTSRAKRASAFAAALDWSTKLPDYLRIVEGTH